MYLLKILKGMFMDSDWISFQTLLTAQDTLQATQETARWTYLMMVATWVAGISTSAAVILSLYLANRRPRPIINTSISACILQPIGWGIERGIVINVANAGAIPVVISGIEWTFNAKSKIFQTFERTHSDVIPRNLGPGETASYYLIFKKNEWAKNFVKSIDECGGNIQKLSFNVKIGTGKSFKRKVDKETIELIQNSTD